MNAETTSLQGQILPAISAGLVTGIINVVVGISLAALIFTGTVSAYAANGIGLLLLGAILPTLFINLFSSYKGTASATQDAPAAILAVMAAGIKQSMPTSSPHEQFISIVAVIVVTTLLTALFFIFLGQFKLGSLVRFLPYPVIGGFLAGTGWLLFVGGIGVMSDIPFSFGNLGDLFLADIFTRWAAGTVLAFLMFWILNRYKHVLILPAILLGTAALFYAVALFTGTPLAALRAQGWLLGPFPNSSLIPSLNFSDLSQIHWNAVVAQAGGVASILLISVVSLLLNASAIELVIRKDLDLNREMRMIGLGNILGGLTGGTLNFHALLDTTVNHRVGKDSRLSIWINTAIFASPLLIGAAALSYIPKVALGVPLVLFGLFFLYEWVYLSWFNFSRLEYLVIILILVVIAVFGFLQGVGIGLLAAVVLFVVNYSGVSVTKHALSGAELQSRFTRSPNQRKTLIAQGDRTFILQLQGFIFFGTANKLLDQVRARVEKPDQAPPQFLILDFAKVSGLDSTAMLSFFKMQQILQDRNTTILITAPSAEVLKQFKKGGFISQASDKAMAFPDLDHGLEWVENRLLSAVGEQQEATLPLKEIFHQLLPDDAQLNSLFNFLEKKVVPTGTYLMHQQDAPDNIYFVESGQVTAQLEFPGKPPVRLETMKSGRVIGEIGFYLGQKRTAAVVADEPSTIYLLSAKNLARMEDSSPEVASYFHHLIVQLLAERTTHLIRTVTALEK